MCLVIVFQLNFQSLKTLYCTSPSHWHISIASHMNMNKWSKSWMVACREINKSEACIRIYQIWFYHIIGRGENIQSASPNPEKLFSGIPINLLTWFEVKQNLNLILQEEIKLQHQLFFSQPKQFDLVSPYKSSQSLHKLIQHKKF